MGAGVVVVENPGLTVAWSLTDEPYTHFLADDTGRTVVELHTNRAAAIPDNRMMHPPVFHVAFVSANTVADRMRLTAAEASFFAEESTADGSSLLMMRPLGSAAGNLPVFETVLTSDECITVKRIEQRIAKLR